MRPKLTNWFDRSRHAAPASAQRHQPSMIAIAQPRLPLLPPVRQAPARTGSSPAAASPCPAAPRHSPRRQRRGSTARQCSASARQHTSMHLDPLVPRTQFRHLAVGAHAHHRGVSAHVRRCGTRRLCNGGGVGLVPAALGHALVGGASLDRLSFLRPRCAGGQQEHCAYRHRPDNLSHDHLLPEGITDASLGA